MLIFFSFVLYMGIAVHVKYNQVNKALVELNSQVKVIEEQVNTVYSQSNENVKNGNIDREVVDFLKEEFANYKDFASSDRESFFNLLTLFITAAGVLITGFAIVQNWHSEQTKKQIKENANLAIRNSIVAIERDAKEKIKRLINPKLKDFEEKYKELERFMEN